MRLEVQFNEAVTRADTRLKVQFDESVTQIDGGFIAAGNIAKGDKGDKGDPGAAATIAVGAVSTLAPGSSATVTNSGTSDAAVFDFGIPQGAAGQDGQDGVSPTISSEAITGGHQLTIVDASGTTTVDVMDGTDGQDGADGTSAGFGTPTATVDANVGTPGVSVSASGPDTAKVFAFSFTNLKGATGATGQTGPAGPGVPASGSAGQALRKKSGTDYDTEWYTPPAASVSTPNADYSTGAVGSSTDYAREDHKHPLNVPTTGTPAMDGTAALGSAGTYARSDHVHPTDTSKQDVLVSGTNIKTINNNSILGSGDITITGGGDVQTVNGVSPDANGDVEIDTVYVGTSAPTDPAIQIWLDTDEPGMSAVSSVNGATGTVVLDADDVGAMSEWVLLWTNASPTSNFAAQSIAIDISNYVAIAVEHKVYPSIDEVHTDIGFVGTSFGLLHPASGSGYFSTATTQVGYRGVNLKDTSKITIGNGYASNAGANFAVSDNRCIPIRIFGIKGVQTS